MGGQDEDKCPHTTWSSSGLHTPFPELTLFVLESFADITAKETEFLQRDLGYHPSICEDGGHTWACAEGEMNHPDSPSPVSTESREEGMGMFISKCHGRLAVIASTSSRAWPQGAIHSTSQSSAHHSDRSSAAHLSEHLLHFLLLK